MDKFFDMRKLFYLIVLFVFFVSCQSDETKVVETLETDTNQSIGTGENGGIADTSSTVIAETKADTNKTTSVIEKAKDVDAQLSTKVNKSKNPDNMNGSEDTEIQSNITLIPVISEADKAFFYVQILESPTKLSKNYFDKYFKTKQDVYVISEGGVYKYCIGKYKNETDAKSYMKEVKSKFRFKSISIASFSQTW